MIEHLEETEEWAAAQPERAPMSVEVRVSPDTIGALIKSGRLAERRRDDYLAVQSALRQFIHDITTGKEPVPPRRWR